MAGEMILTNEHIEKLNNFWETHEANYEENGNYFFDDNDSKEALEVESIFFDFLCPDGYIVQENKAILAQNGFRTWIGDGDSFGILVCCVTKDGKTFSFG